MNRKEEYDMTDHTIQLEYMTCPKCGMGMEKWNLKVEALHGVLGVRCPHCREELRLIMKGGESTSPVAESEVQGTTIKSKEGE
jgi:DNA-directed RNA polymerase subunit RPC12/RpoP